MRTGLAQGFAEHVMRGGQRPSTIRTRPRGRTRLKREQERRNARDTNHRFVDFTPFTGDHQETVAYAAPLSASDMDALSGRFMVESIHPFDATRVRLEA